MDGTERQEGNDEYNEFLDKFEIAKTTDDCFTPDNIYDAVAEYVEKRYALNRKQFKRPFFPNGDYQSEKYGKNDVVVDNPPFSILAQIIDFYRSRGIRFFLFVPALTAMNYCNKENVTILCVNARITYENGASVNTAFATNLGDTSICAESDPDLTEKIKEVNEINEKAMHKNVPKYEYPYEVLTGAKLGYFSQHGERFSVRWKDCTLIRQLDAQKESGSAIYGCGLLLSERAAAERAAAERAAAERADTTKWKLSDRELEIVRSLGH
jgi:hypothetical protein